MDAIPPDLLITNRQAAGGAGGAAPGELDRDAFLKLLISQLENQDPLSPLKDHEFVAQLATFSSLEQLENLNASMQASLLVSQSVNNSLATNLIGKEILAEGDEIRLGEEGGASFVVELDAPADVTVIIRDERGNVVRRISAGELAAGENAVEWDGTDEDGERVAEGAYRLEVVASGASGEPVDASLRIRALVTGVRFEDGTGYLMLGNQSVPLSSVLQVFAPSGS